MQFLYQLSDSVTRWLRGRNGSDELGNATLVLSFILIFINAIVDSVVLTLVSFAVCLYVWFRMCSRNIEKRRAENEVFVKLVGPAAPFLRNPFIAFSELREYKHITCPDCKQRLRVPRGKGKLRVSCPKCGKSFEGRS